MQVPIQSTSFSKDAGAEPKYEEVPLRSTFALYTASKSAAFGRWLAEVRGKPWPYFRGLPGRLRPFHIEGPFGARWVHFFPGREGEAFTGPDASATLFINQQTVFS